MANDYRFRIEFWAITGCILLVGAIIELVRRNQLKERYSFLWFATAAVLCGFALRRDWLEDFAQIMGVYYPPTALFLVLVFFMMLILIHFSTAISRLLSDRQALTQSVGMLEARIRELESTRQGPGVTSPIDPAASL
ncbi:MAG: DUF2304 domain-containing protein [Bdellovibrionia bacterium]